MGETKIEGDVLTVTHPDELAAGIRRYRERREQILAQAAKRSGKSLRHINRMEKRQKDVNPKLDTLLSLSAALNVAIVIDGRQRDIPENAPPLTTGRARVLDIICNYIRRHDEAPTVQEIADAMGIHISAAYDYLQRLAAKGYIRREKGPRTIRVLIRPKSGGESTDA